MKGPFKPAEGNPKKRAIWGFKEEPGDGTAAKSLTRWLKRETNGHLCIGQTFLCGTRGTQPKTKSHVITPIPIAT